MKKLMQKDLLIKILIVIDANFISNNDDDDDNDDDNAGAT